MKRNTFRTIRSTNAKSFSAILCHSMYFMVIFGKFLTSVGQLVTIDQYELILVYLKPPTTFALSTPNRDQSSSMHLHGTPPDGLRFSLFYYSGVRIELEKSLSSLSLKITTFMFFTVLLYFKCYSQPRFLINQVVLVASTLAHTFDEGLQNFPHF